MCHTFEMTATESVLENAKKTASLRYDPSLPMKYGIGGAGMFG